MRVAKYRSWNSIDECFYYFINGEYFNSSDETVESFVFNWKNAEQSTGLHDKNGREIYEGDIVSFHNPISDRVEDTYLVRWNDVSHEFTLHNSPMGKFLEIIGNIHENPELLSEVK